MKFKKSLIPVLLLGAILLVSGCASKTSETNFSYHDANAPVMYFFQPNCVHCAQEKVILEELASEGYRWNVIDVSVDRTAIDTYAVPGTPTFIASNGDRLVGFQEKDALVVWMEAHGGKFTA